MSNEVDTLQRVLLQISNVLEPLERELSGRFSARRGPYRVLYAINDEVDAVTILHIDHRSDVYRNG